MGVWVVFVLFLIGLFLIIKGGDIFVDAATWIAEVSGIPKFLIGATIVSLATTLPEMLVSLIAAAYGKVDMAVGNAIGSVTVNAGLILGFAVFCVPCAVKMEQFRVKAVLMLLAALTLLIFVQIGQLTWIPVIILFAIFGVFVYENIRSAKRNAGINDKEGVSQRGSAAKYRKLRNRRGLHRPWRALTR